MMHFSNLGCILLAGGEGKRVQGANKGLLELHGKSFVKHLLDRFSNQCQEIIISANRDLDQFKTFGYSVIPDSEEWKERGPLSGIVSCFPHFSSSIETNLVLPCDTPFLPDNLIEKLMDSLSCSPETEIVYAATKDRIHPSIFTCRSYINGHLAQHIREGQQSLRSWILKHNSKAVYFDGEPSFANINDFETLNSFR